MIKLLIGGSPCTYWSIAQKNNRETQAEGMGWELFKNYLIAKEKFKPDFFLYENNKSAAQAIKDQIKTELKVFDGSLLMEDTGARYIEINSALVSAQNRQRFYVHNCGEVEQPEDRGILLKDILENNAVSFHAMDDDKCRTLTANYWKTSVRDALVECAGGRTMAVEAIPVNTSAVGVGYRNSREDDGKLYRRFETHGEEKANCITTVQTDSMVAEPIRVGALPRPNGELSTSQGFRIYSPDGKSVALKGEAGGAGGKTGLYAIPVENVGECETIQKAIPKLVDKYGYLPEQFNAYNLAEINDKSPTLSTGSMATSSCATTKFEKVCDCCIFNDTENCKTCPLKNQNVYEVKDGLITIKGKQYPIKLPDGLYIIRKLTVTECCRLQTMPDDYCRAVSNSQAYKGLGNCWTAEVIIHILNGALKDVPKDEEIIVLSMYDGIGTGRYCLDKMGFTNVKYYAYEIDKYAKQIAMSNYPDIIQMGDAFDIRHPDWTIGY